MKLLKDIKNLIWGLCITGKHLGRHAITIQYPEEKWTMPERSRGIVVLLSDKETGELNCTACMLCMRACPTAAIKIDAPRDENKKRRLKSFVVENSLCCFCGLCEEACNFSAIKMATMYEFSTTIKEELVWDMKKLQEMGRDVDYVDTRKKKTAKPAPKPASKPTEDTKATSDTPEPDAKTNQADDTPEKTDNTEKPSASAGDDNPKEKGDEG